MPLPWSPACWLTRWRLSAYRDGEVGATLGLRMEAHLDRCPGCSAELDGLERLRAWLREPEQPETGVPAATWDAFWPGVQARLAEVPETATPRPWAVRMWEPVWGHPRLVLGSALAATALAVVAIMPPWQQPALRGAATGGPASSPAPVTSPGDGLAAQPAAREVVVHSVESADPQSNVMVFANPESDVTVVWVFGLPRTDT